MHAHGTNNLALHVRQLCWQRSHISNETLQTDGSNTTSNRKHTISQSSMSESASACMTGQEQADFTCPQWETADIV